MNKLYIKADVYNELIEKGYGKRDLSKLTRKVITDKNGHRRTVFVRNEVKMPSKRMIKKQQDAFMESGKDKVIEAVKNVLGTDNVKVSAFRSTKTDGATHFIAMVNYDEVKDHLKNDSAKGSLAAELTKLGLKPDESDTEEGGGASSDAVAEGEGIRFPKLHLIDEEFAGYKVQNYNNSFTLPELVENFRNFAASQLKLYYKTEMIRLYISALASTKLVILQGISGTGKTSLAYAWGKFLKHDSCVASVQPSWRDRTELFGYFNEFTKKFNETEVLKEMYLAGYTDDVYTIILDEMNISRVEYYFAEMLSILEMPNKDEWIVELVSAPWKSDPKRIVDGKLKIPPNMWYIGTINNDDSTFMVTDKVYDRAMPIDINDKGEVFEPTDTPAQDINYSYLDKLFTEAIENNPMSKDILDKIEEMDNYVIQHFRIAFGNRIVAHMKKFVPVYVACGGTEVNGVDYFLARKVLRKFEQLNVSYIRDEIDGYIEFLDKTFGKGAMKECEEYLLRLKKLS